MKTALVTGASSGIGEAFARELAQRNTNLVLVARSLDKLQELAEELAKKFAIEVEVIDQDLTLSGASQLVFQKITDKGLTIDLLVNNAGFGDYGAFAARPLEKQINMIQLNIVALVQLTHLFLNGMRQRKQGGIINVASIAAYQPIPYLSVYAATKSFVLSFSEALWAENKADGINILAVCPGPTESQFFQAAEFPASFAKNSNKNSLVSAEDVVKDALQALEKNQPTLVTGGLGNQVIANLSRFFPRKTVVSLVEKQFRHQG